MTACSSGDQASPSGGAAAGRIKVVASTNV
jgi:hypothetical protein